MGRLVDLPPAQDAIIMLMFLGSGIRDFFFATGWGVDPTCHVFSFQFQVRNKNPSFSQSFIINFGFGTF